MSERAVGRATVRPTPFPASEIGQELQRASNATYSAHDIELRIVQTERVLTLDDRQMVFQVLFQVHRESRTVASLAAADYERAKAALEALTDAWAALSVQRRFARQRRDVAGPGAGWLYQRDYLILAEASFDMGIATGQLLTEVERIMALIGILNRRTAELEQLIRTKYGQPGRDWDRRLGAADGQRAMGAFPSE